MPEAELPWVFTDRLEAADVSYVLVGAYAAIAFGVYRTTSGIDFVFMLEAGELGRLEAVFPDTEFYRPPREVLREEFARGNGGHFNLIHHDSGWKADCYPAGRDPLQAWAFGNRCRITHNGRQVWVAPPELVILKKLEFFREGGSEKHINDIRGILLATDVDHPFLQSNIERLNLVDEWRLCIA